MLSILRINTTGLLQKSNSIRAVRQEFTRERINSVANTSIIRVIFIDYNASTIKPLSGTAKRMLCETTSLVTS